jgi:Helix-turn-helix domain
LVVEQTGKHYRAMRSAVWLYLYLVVHADRQSGELFRRIATIAQDMGLKAPTIGRWMAALRKHSYIRSEKTGRALKITVLRWKRLRPSLK